MKDFFIQDNVTSKKKVSTKCDVISVIESQSGFPIIVYAGGAKDEGLQFIIDMKLKHHIGL